MSLDQVLEAPPEAKPLPIQVCMHLPTVPRLMLVAASKISDPFERRSAIEHAAQRARREYPDFFHIKPL